MDPTVAAAWIAAGVSVLTLAGTLAAQYYGYRATSRDAEKTADKAEKTAEKTAEEQRKQLDRTLVEQRDQLDRTLAEQNQQLDRTLAEQRTRTFNERFATAAEQLGDDKPPTVRLAGPRRRMGRGTRPDRARRPRPERRTTRTRGHRAQRRPRRPRGGGLSASRPRTSPVPSPAAVPEPFTGKGPVPEPPTERLAYSVDEAARLTGLSRDLLYDQMRRGHLAYRKVGRRLITRQHLEQFLDITASVQPPAQDPAAGHQAADDAPRPPARGQAHA
jgi:excisionase family DNA binding protein